MITRMRRCYNQVNIVMASLMIKLMILPILLNIMESSMGLNQWVKKKVTGEQKEDQKMIILEEIINVVAIKDIFLILLCTLTSNKSIMEEPLPVLLLEIFLLEEEEADLKKFKVMIKILKKHQSMELILKIMRMAMK